jgi:hypothetical protein
MEGKKEVCGLPKVVDLGLLTRTFVAGDETSSARQ